MRDIKFRAFDKKLKIYIPEEYIGISGEGKLYNNSMENCLSSCDNWIIEQYTGLKDNKANELYEGDIIKVSNWGFRNKSKLCNAKVIWDIDFHGWTWESDFGESRSKEFEIDAYDRWRNIEVIGNIHENPELL